MIADQKILGVTLVLGGAKSGKSAFAEDWVNRQSKGLYLATAQSFDDEMKKRITAHQERRGANWTLVEEPLDLAKALLENSQADRPVLVDCLTLWISNLMMAEQNLDQAFDELIKTLDGLAGPVIFVSNEVGQGIVPDNAMARAFRDHAGLLHQRIAARAHRVVFVTAGLPQILKDDFS